MALNKKQIDQFRRRLEEERQQIVLQVREAVGQGSSFHGDFGDRSISLAAIEGELDLEEFERNRLVDIEEALQRMDEGVYGVCVKCGKKIPLERLEAVPTAEYDAKCKEEVEKEQSEQ